MKAHCLFEQSGTFKNAFRKYGIDSYDYDIQDEFGETDYVIDLFKEIRGGYNENQSIFDDIKEDDIILAFFPCTYFECQNQLWFAGNNYAQRGYSDEKNCELVIKRHKELNEFYEVLNKLVIICIRRNLKLIIENPYSQPHYLTTYWCIKPSIIDTDRTANGDFYKKPTQYWFINCKPKNNLVFEAIDYVEKKDIVKAKATNFTSRKTERSMIHPQYADRFIRQYVIDENIWMK
jgi:hypothetical protein